MINRLVCLLFRHDWVPSDRHPMAARWCTRCRREEYHNGTRWRRVPAAFRCHYKGAPPWMIA